MRPTATSWRRGVDGVDAAIAAAFMAVLALAASLPQLDPIQFIACARSLALTTTGCLP